MHLRRPRQRNAATGTMGDVAQSDIIPGNRGEPDKAYPEMLLK
jgi:hypothetical protein